MERARYEAERAERRFRNVEPESRLVARTPETERENKLQDQRALEVELARKEHEQWLPPLCFAASMTDLLEASKSLLELPGAFI